ncbi:MAG: hypothetical protein HOO97_07950 [Sideroxydans sp.]|nr:hypothetical protein [Sideroxydans sp.]
MNHAVDIPQSLLKRLDKIASPRLTKEAIVKQAIQDRLEYEEWKQKKVNASLKRVDSGHVVSKDEFWDQLAKIKNARKKAA